MKQIPFRIVGLQVESFVLNDNQLRDKKAVAVNTSYEFGVNATNHLVMVRIVYKYFQDEAELLHMSLVSTFDVKQEDFDEMMIDNKFTLEPFFSQYLSTINIGAARGEIHARCEAAKSKLAEIILPPINLVEALPNPIEIEV